MSLKTTDTLEHVLLYNFNFEKPESSTVSPTGKAKQMLVPWSSSVMTSAYITAGKCYLTWEHCLMINSKYYNSLVFQEEFKPIKLVL